MQAVPAQATYEFTNGWLSGSDEPQSAASVVKFSRPEDWWSGRCAPGGHGALLYEGRWRAPQFIWREQHRPYADGELLALKTGDAFDVKVKAVVEQRQKLGDSKWRTTMRYELTNAKPDAVTVDLVQSGLGLVVDRYPYITANR